MEKTNNRHYRGIVRQIPIYLAKFFRMFIYMDDWKTVPMAFMIASLVSYVIRNMMFVDMEGTLKGALALSCVCVWNGCFNSIQVVCRERDIIKREHRSGMHVSSYIISHMIYQAFLCLLQTCVTVGTCYMFGIKFPEKGLIIPIYLVELGVSMFIISYAADMMSLLISCIARTTTAAMTIMPFVLIFELVFSGGMFSLSGFGKTMTNFSIAKWGISCIAAQADVNTLPVSTVWKQLKKLKNADAGDIPIKEIIEYMDENNMGDVIGMEMAKLSAVPEYDYTEDNVKNSWFALVIFSLLEAGAAAVVLSRIDKDKR